MKNFFAALLVFFSLNVFAAQTDRTVVDITNLSQEQKALIFDQVGKLTASDSNNTSAVIRKETEAWGELGANIGKAMVGAAKEIGMAANEFSQTSLGKIVVIGVVYKLVGRELLKVIYGTMLIVFGCGVGLFVLCSNRWSNVKYEYEPVLFGLFKKSRIVSLETESDVVATKMFVGFAVIAVSLIFGLNIVL